VSAQSDSRPVGHIEVDVGGGDVSVDQAAVVGLVEGEGGYC